MPKSHVSAKTAQLSDLPVIPVSDPAGFQAALLGWYDRHARVLPWRAPKGKKADPYHVWMSEIMLQQTTVQAVAAYFEKFTTRWPSVHDLANANPDDVMQAWAGLGYYARARNLLACAGVISKDLKGKFPQTEEELLALPGIGPYTSAAISAIAFDRQATVIDGNVDRVMTRVAQISQPLPAGKPEVRKQANIVFQNVSRPGDFAQAMMDLGATICTPRSPKCGLCPVSSFCQAKASGRQEEFPAKMPKKKRPQRHGVVYWLKTADGRIAYERRSADRMLGGMPGLPTSDWDMSGTAFDVSRLKAEQMIKVGTVHHTFTHFDLTLDILSAPLPAVKKGWDDWMFCAESDIYNIGFPTVFRKAVRFAATGTHEKK